MLLFLLTLGSTLASVTQETSSSFLKQDPDGSLSESVSGRENLTKIIICDIIIIIAFFLVVRLIMILSKNLTVYLVSLRKNFKRSEYIKNLMQSGKT